MKRKWNYLLRLFRNMKFRNKLMLTYFIIGIGPVALLGTFCFFQTKNILVEREQKNLQTSLIQSVTNMDNQIKIYNNLSDYISYNQTISEVIGYDTQDEYQKYEQYTKILDPMLTSLKYFHNDLGKITLYTSSSMVQHDTTLDSIQKIREEFWYRKVMSEDFKESYWFVRGDKAISVCSMHSLETMGMRGVLYLDLNVSKLFHNLKKLSQSGYGVIVEDENGNSIFHYEGGGVKKLSLKECQKQRKDYTIAQENSITNWKVWLYKPYRSIINSIWSIA